MIWKHQLSMNKFYEILEVFFNGLYVGSVLLLPMIGAMFFLELDLKWVEFLCLFISFVLIEIYGRYYYKFYKHSYSTKLKIHHDVENNNVWVESNDTIDSIIDIEIVKHVNFEK